MTYFTAPNAMAGGLPVDAKVTFTTTTDKITVSLENFIVDPRSVIQNISGLLFTVSTGQTTGTLSSSSGMLREIDSKGNYTDQGVNSTGWRVTTSGSQLYLDVLGAPAGPANTIIGAPSSSSDKYKNANKSIAGNGPHNPFIAGSAAFELYVPGVTSETQINKVTFLFGTAGEPYQVPEPATLAFLSLGCFGFLRPRKKL